MFYVGKVALHGLGPLGDISEEVPPSEGLLEVSGGGGGSFLNLGGFALQVFGLTGVRCCYVAILASQFGIAVVPWLHWGMGVRRLSHHTRKPRPMSMLSSPPS